MAQIQPWSLATALNGHSLMATRKNLSALRRRSPNPANRMRVTCAQYDQYYRFSIVRNPWTRAVSWFNNVQRDPIHQATLAKEPAAFKTFLTQQIGKGMLRPQTYWLRDRSGKIDLDFVGRFENLATDFEKACDAIGAEVTLPNLLNSGASRGVELYDDTSNRLIRDHYAEEIELFGYSFPEAD